MQEVSLSVQFTSACSHRNLPVRGPCAVFCKIGQVLKFLTACGKENPGLNAFFTSWIKGKAQTQGISRALFFSNVFRLTSDPWVHPHSRTNQWKVKMEKVERSPANRKATLGKKARPQKISRRPVDHWQGPIKKRELPGWSWRAGDDFQGNSLENPLLVAGAYGNWC